MLELRPNCECCDKDLPPDAMDARICTFECRDAGKISASTRRVLKPEGCTRAA
ncbi:MAG: DUF1272 domain-containing protein [Rhizomicrobium sp.]